MVDAFLFRILKYHQRKIQISLYLAAIQNEWPLKRG